MTGYITGNSRSSSRRHNHSGARPREDPFVLSSNVVYYVSMGTPSREVELTQHDIDLVTVVAEDLRYLARRRRSK